MQYLDSIAQYYCTLPTELVPAQIQMFNAIVRSCKHTNIFNHLVEYNDHDHEGEG